MHAATSEFGFRFGNPNTDWNKLSSLITECIWWKLQVYAIDGPSGHSDGWVHLSSQVRSSSQKELNVPPHVFCHLK